jgi:hypothetical protein
MQRNPAKSSVPKLSEFRFDGRTWSYVGSSRIRSNLLRLVGESGGLVVYADQRDADAPGVLYVPSGPDRYDLYREQRSMPHPAGGYGAR